MTALQGRTRRWLLWLTALASAAACSDSVAPRQLKAPNPSAIIVDGAHNGGNDDVYFLPPLVGDPSGKPGFGDPEDLNLPVNIKVVCQSHPSTSTCPNFDFPPSAVKSSSDAHYMVNWDTKAPGVDPGDIYRIEVHVGSKTIAWADVFLVPNGNPKNIATQGDIPLNDGRTMPIKVRIEKGWSCVDRTNKTCTTQVVGNTPVGSPITVIAPQNTAAGQFEGNWIPFCTSTPTPGCVPPGTQVVVTVEDQTAILNQPPAGGGTAPTCALINDGVALTHMLSDTHCVKFTTDPEFKFASPVKVAVCVHADETTQQLLKYDVDETPRFLRNVPFTVNGVDFTALCEQGESQIGSRSSGMANYALAMLSKVGRAVGSLLVPKNAYAIHTGVGGFIDAGDGFSYVSPGRPLTLSAFAGDKQSAIVGGALANPVQVRISTVHRSFDFESGFPNPLNNLPVTCSIDQGSGTFPVIEGPAITTANVFTDVNGIATCPSWILGKEGANTLRVSTPNIDDGIIAIEEFQGEGGVFPQPVTLSNNATFTATGVQQTSLINCDISPGGDLVSRGFYVPGFPGTALTQVNLLFSGDVPGTGTYTLSLTAHSGRYDGPVVGTSSTTLSLAQNQFTTGTFTFPPSAVAPGSTVAFVIDVVSKPAGSVSPFYGVANTFNGVPSCPVNETEGTSAGQAGLDTFRRQGVAVQIFGAASNP